MTLSHKAIEALQGVYFDICDLLDSGQIDDIHINEPEGYETLREFLEAQKQSLELVEEELGGEAE